VVGEVAAARATRAALTGAVTTRASYQMPSGESTDGAPAGDALEDALARVHVAVVVPAYEAAATLADVLASIPAFVRTIVVVDDGSTDDTRAVAQDAAARDPRVRVERHPGNRGVGAAMCTGYVRALRDGAEIVAKMDADGQMDPAYLARLVLPIALGDADYAKGNRFLRPDAIARMPLVRLVGNAGLSFIAKLSSGYWQVMDPTNGYTAIGREALSLLDTARLDDGFFFESSMLVELALVRAVVVDVPMPARYGAEASHLSVVRSLAGFGPKHVRALARRVLHRYVLADFSAVSLFLTVGTPLLAFGVVFGGWKWFRSIVDGVPATAGTVMLAAATTGAGLYCLVQALLHDAMAGPQRPLTPPRMR
jgi:dolichol-phosphate mannosyltransferase